MTDQTRHYFRHLPAKIIISALMFVGMMYTAFAVPRFAQESAGHPLFIVIIVGVVWILLLTMVFELGGIH